MYTVVELTIWNNKVGKLSTYTNFWPLERHPKELEIFFNKDLGKMQGVSNINLYILLSSNNLIELYKSYSVNYNCINVIVM